MADNKIKKFFEKESTQGWAMIFPNTIGLVVFYLIPICWSILLAFFEWNGLSKMKFINIENFLNLFHDSLFIHSIRNTFIYSLVVVPAILLIVIIFGAFLSKEDIFDVKNLRTLFFLPLMTMPVAATLVWKWLLNLDYGLINKILTIMNLDPIPWLSDSRYVLISIIFIGIWLGVAYDLIIIISGIKGIPKIYYEAARIDGASPFRQFTSITLPLLSPSIFFILITQLISCFQVFDSAFIILGADPAMGIKNAASTIVMSIYENGFVYFKMGYSSAQSFILFLIILTITVIQFRVQKRWVHYA
ncbi:MAG: carbohydrate ABC transporter permease [Pleomorphochaeta sp.]